MATAFFVSIGENRRQGHERMTIKTAGLSQKQLLEKRAALVNKAQAHHAENEDNWTPERDAEHEEMMADVEHLSLAIASRKALQGGTSIAQDPMAGFSPRRGGYKPSDDVVFLNSDEQLSATAGFESPVACGVGEAVRVMVAPDSRYANVEMGAFLGSGRDSTGGFNVPITLSSEVIDLARAQSQLIRAGARTVVMKSEETRIAKVTSGPAMQVKAEGASFDDATMTIGGVVLKAFVIGAYLEVSRELAEDSPNFSQLVQSQLSKSLAASMDRLGTQGTGSGEPVGLTVHPDVAETAGVGVPTWDDLSLASTEVRKRNHEPSSVILNPEIHDILRISKDGENRYLGAPPTLEGTYWGATNNCPTANAIVGDFQNMIVGIRQNPLIETSAVAGDTFKKHLIAVKVTWRGDWALTDASAFQRLAGVTTS
jgi:HK97 family phage major capsid protein